MLVEKEVIRPGTYWYRDEATGKPRKLVVTPELTKYWHEQGNAMLSAGLTVPVPCEHDFNAHPMTPADKLLNNAGWVDGYFFKKVQNKDGSHVDALFSKVDVKDPGIAKKLPGTIRWTSPWINSFTDGNGKEWKNVISHLALTTRPRIVEQEPFGSVAAALSMATKTEVDATGNGYCLSNAGLLGDDDQPAYPIAFSVYSGVTLGNKNISLSTEWMQDILPHLVELLPIVAGWLAYSLMGSKKSKNNQPDKNQQTSKGNPKPKRWGQPITEEEFDARDKILGKGQVQGGKPMQSGTGGGPRHRGKGKGGGQFIGKGNPMSITNNNNQPSSISDANDNEDTLSVLMALEPGKKKPLAQQPPNDDDQQEEDNTYNEMDNEAPDDGDESNDDTVDLAPFNDPAGDVSMTEILCDLLGALGIQCEHDGDEATFKRSIYNAAMTKIHELTGKAQNDGKDPNRTNPPGQPPNNPKQQGQKMTAQPNPLIQQEQQPMYMSLDDINQLPDPMKGVALAMYNENQRLRAEMNAAKKITDSLRDGKIREATQAREKRVAVISRLSPRVKEDLDAMLKMPSMAMSMGDSGNVIDPMAHTLAIIEKGLSDIPLLLTTEQSALSVQAQPNDNEMLEEEKADRIANNLARQMGCTVKSA